MSYQQEKFKEIADKIREKTGTTESIKPIDFKDEVGNVFDAGKKAQYDEFWDAFQKNGERSHYYMGFCYWEDACYNPKYPIVTAETGSVANMMFDSAKITDTKVDIFVNTTGAASMFRQCKYLKRVKRLVLTEKATSFGNFATNCTALTDFNVEGVINGSMDLHWSPLTKESIEKVVSILSDTASGQAVTFSLNAVNNAFTEEEWESLISAKQNWTFALV